MSQRSRKIPSSPESKINGSIEYFNIFGNKMSQTENGNKFPQSTTFLSCKSVEWKKCEKRKEKQRNNNVAKHQFVTLRMNESMHHISSTTIKRDFIRSFSFVSSFFVPFKLSSLLLSVFDYQMKDVMMRRTDDRSLTQCNKFDAANEKI